MGLHEERWIILADAVHGGVEKVIPGARTPTLGIWLFGGRLADWLAPLRVRACVRTYVAAVVLLK